MQIVTEAAFARWRMQRVWTIETGLLDLEMDSQADELAEQFETIDEGIRQASAFKRLADQSVSLELIHRYEARYRRSFEKALATLRSLREMDLQPQLLPDRTDTQPAPQVVENPGPKFAAEDRNVLLPNELPAVAAVNTSEVPDLSTAPHSNADRFGHKTTNVDELLLIEGVCRS